MLEPSTVSIGRSDPVSWPLMVSAVLSEAKVQPSFGLESLETGGAGQFQRFRLSRHGNLGN
jgi:hypothetical protein